MIKSEDAITMIKYQQYIKQSIFELKLYEDKLCLVFNKLDKNKYQGELSPLFDTVEEIVAFIKGYEAHKLINSLFEDKETK